MHMLKIALTQQFFDAQIHLSSSFMVTISRWPRVPTSRVVRRLRGLEEHVAIQYGVFQRWGLPQNGRFVMANPIKMDDDWG